MSLNAFSPIHAYICHENLYLAFNQINYENAADTRICKLTTFLEIFALAAVRSKVVVLLLLIVTPIVGFCNCSMFCCSLLCVHSSFTIISMGKREQVALLCLFS